MKRSVNILILVILTATAYAQKKNPHIISGNKLYRENKFEEALPEYMKAKEVAGNDPVVNYNLGNTYFRNKNFEEATKTFDNTIESGNNSSMKQKGFYNKGVSLSKQRKLEESIEAYKMAVKLDPADNDARINLQKALLELKKKLPPPPEKKEEKKKKQQQNKSPQKQPPQSNLTKKQVEQLLKALQQREQQVQQKMQQRNRTAGQQEKDW
jgi:Ca-activated chloride channel homolog